MIFFLVVLHLAVLTAYAEALNINDFQQVYDRLKSNKGHYLLSICENYIQTLNLVVDDQSIKTTTKPATISHAAVKVHNVVNTPESTPKPESTTTTGWMALCQNYIETMNINGHKVLFSTTSTSATDTTKSPLTTIPGHSSTPSLPTSSRPTTSPPTTPHGK